MQVGHQAPSVSARESSPGQVCHMDDAGGSSEDGIRGKSPHGLR